MRQLQKNVRKCGCEFLSKNYNAVNILKYMNGNYFTIKAFCEKIKEENNQSFEGKEFCSGNKILSDGAESKYVGNRIEDSGSILEDGGGVVLNRSKDISRVKFAKKFLKDVMELGKFKLSLLNTMVSASMFAFYSTPAHVLADFLLFTGGTLCISMTSQVLNQIYERYLDKKMKRTCKRPLPTQRMTVGQAGLISGILWTTSTALYLLSAPQAILFSNMIIAVYMLYTYLKKVSNLAMHVGAIVGALTPILGSYAATGLLFQSSSLLLASYLFAWQYPHFYGILYKNKDDYKRNFKFISNDESKTHIAYYQMIAAMVLMFGVTYLVYKENKGIIDKKVFAIWSFFFAINFIAVLKFIKNPTMHASNIRSKTYAPFLIILFCFMKAGYDKRENFLTGKEIEKSKDK